MMDATTPFDPLDGPLDYERIKALSSRERPAYTLIAMAPKNDPFYIMPGRRRKAEWFAATGVITEGNLVCAALAHGDIMHNHEAGLPFREFKIGIGDLYGSDGFMPADRWRRVLRGEILKAHEAPSRLALAV